MLLIKSGRKLADKRTDVRAITQVLPHACGAIDPNHVYTGAPWCIQYKIARALKKVKCNLISFMACSRKLKRFGNCEIKRLQILFNNKYVRFACAGEMTVMKIVIIQFGHFLRVKTLMF